MSEPTPKQPPTQEQQQQPETPTWQTLVAKKQAECASKVPPEWLLSEDLLATLPLTSAEGVNLIAADVPRKSGLLSELELEITEKYTAKELVQKLATGEFKSVDVTRAFCKRAAIAQQLTSCLTETFYPRALERAEYLDTYLKNEGKVLGPLHGLPISIKDSFCVEGVQSTVGFVALLEHEPAKTNSALVDLLLDLGAVLYVKTNIPQTMMTADSENNIFGRTLNPHSTTLTAGGSSGGEGALVAFRGSPLGVGTDIAGSIRIPSLCCGTYGFKPSVDRIPFGGGVSGAMEGVPGLKPSAGPLGNSLDDIELFMSTVLNGEAWKYDSTAFAVGWNTPPSPSSSSLEDEGEKKLTIGILPENPFFPIYPPVRRTLTTAITALKNKGHKIVSIPSTPLELDIAYISRLAFQYFIYGPHEDLISASGEPAVTSVAKGAHPLFSGPMPVKEDLGVFEKIDGLHKARQAVNEAWRKMWVELGLDVIVSPAAQNTAVPHDTFGWPPYTVMWNLLDYPAIIIPYGKSSQELDPEPFVSENDVQPSYTPSATDGAPCSIQIITPKFQDEKCLAAAKIIDRDIRD